MHQSLSIDPGRMGVLFVDLQEEQRHHAHYSVVGFAGILGNASDILLAARKHDAHVFHAAYRRDFTMHPPRPFEPTSRTGTPAFSDVSDPLTRICSEVAPLESEPVIYKNDASAFCGGDLEPLLKSANLDWLAVCGVWTEACIAATVRDAMTAGLRVLLVKDACGSGTVAMHQTGVLNIANRLYGGGVADTARTLDLLGGKAAEVWRPERPVPVLFNYADATRYYQDL